MGREILTIHEVRRRLDRSLELAEKLNKDFLENGSVDTYDLRSIYEYLRVVNSAKWTNQIL